MSNFFKLGLGVILFLLLSTQAFSQDQPPAEDSSADTEGEESSEPLEISSSVSVSYGRLSSTIKPALSGYSVQDGNTFGGSFSGSLSFSGDTDLFSYGFGLSGSSGSGTTKSGANISSESGSVSLGGSINFSFAEEFGLSIGNSVGSGSIVAASVGRGGSPVSISHPSSIGLSGHSFILNYNSELLQAGYGVGNSTAAIPLVAADESNQDDTNGNLTHVLYYANASLLDESLSLGFRSRTSTTTVDVQSQPERPTSPNSNNLVPAIVGRTNRHVSISNGFDVRFSKDALSIGFESGNNLKSIDSGEGVLNVKGDYEKTSSTAIGASYGSFAFAQSNSVTKPVTFVGFVGVGEGKKWEKTSIARTLGYIINDSTHVIYGSRSSKDNSDPDNANSFTVYGSAFINGTKETNEIFIGAVFSAGASN